ncbi:iron-siderophore ABC transporter substrate-binding protein [Pseudovibrio sp. Ad37]|uniref:iron-siderophore ABC transporter substrate-binding protein n=1 Tax=Pseudovibrio sp. Ad37 TaxID=989422 RepID=UPI0007AECD46|nr:iron-siderophore ABC transporter substrate-binding protein [Pseudovibrio sp. Ad37]KZL27941.1 putative siderophore-binding lipoprotein YfiY precursor [Pseudovibrio sp. Ad37]
MQTIHACIKKIELLLYSGLLCLAVSLLGIQQTTAAEFPVVFEHQYGTTTVTAEPKRIVSVSFIGHDFLLALGVKPVALRRWYGSYPSGVWPWAQPALGDAKPTVMWGEINVEQIAAMKPDLILGLWSGMTRSQYKILSQIAPVLVPEARFGDYGTPWQQMTRTIAKAVGRTAKGEQVVQDLEARFSAIKARNPTWLGKSAVVVWPGDIGAYPSSDLRGRFLSDLGFVVSEKVEALVRSDLFYVRVSPEDLDPIDTDVLIWLDFGSGASQINTLRLRPTMRVYNEGREVVATPMIAAALSHSSPLSLSFALDQLEPLIAAAIDGNSATPVATSVEAGITRAQQMEGQ